MTLTGLVEMVIRGRPVWPRRGGCAVVREASGGWAAHYEGSSWLATAAHVYQRRHPGPNTPCISDIGLEL